MTLLAIVTFDLHGAASGEYSRVKKALSTMSLEKQIQSKKKNRPTKLPANTYAAVFSGKWKKKTARKLRLKLSKSVQSVIRGLGLRSTLLVVVGDKWSWGRLTV